MKLKQTPDDFLVEEVTAVVPGASGAFSFYLLEKKGWTTPAALDEVRRRWRIEPRRVSFGGFKDRHATTRQYLTIHHGPRRNFSQPGLSLTHLGQTGEAYASQHIVANRFTLTLRDISASEKPDLQLALAEIRADGLPNYFDEQRFGSVTEDGEFPAKLMVQGRFEQALRQVLTAPYEFDLADAKRAKQHLQEHWGDWPACLAKASPGPGRRPLEYLQQRPDDFRGALERLPPELRGLLFSAYQSELWNRMLARWLQQRARPGQLGSLRGHRGTQPFLRNLEADQLRVLTGASIPFPSARWKPESNDPWAELAHTVLAEEGLPLETMKVRGSRDLFFSRGERAAWILVNELQTDFVADRRHADRLALVLCFTLPRGSYATLLVKRLQAALRVLEEPR